MPATITIGEFSRLTHLPVKTLHHYHDVGVLVPAEIDPATGYRRYAPEQVDAAHLVRRLRDVRMPPAEMRSVLLADPAGRDAGIAAHLDRLHRELTETATAVASLRSLMSAGPAPTPVFFFRDEPARTAVATTAVIDIAEIDEFCAAVYPRLYNAIGRLDAAPAGPGAALYAPGWFENGHGEVTAYVPVDVPSGAEVLPRDDRIRLATIPGGRFAVGLHAGPFEELDLTYGLLGQHVLTGGISTEAPIREIYLVTPADTTDADQLRTEICWPVQP